MSTYTSMKIEVMAKRRLLKYCGVSAKEIPHYMASILWMDACEYVDKEGKTVHSFRRKIDKVCQSGSARTEKIRQILCDFEKREKARAYYVMLKRAGKSLETEIAVLYVREKDQQYWDCERGDVKKLQPMAFVCKLDHPEKGCFQRIVCTVEKGVLVYENS